MLQIYFNICASHALGRLSGCLHNRQESNQPAGSTNQSLCDVLLPNCIATTSPLVQVSANTELGHWLSTRFVGRGLVADTDLLDERERGQVEQGTQTHNSDPGRSMTRCFMWLRRDAVHDEGL